MQSHFNISETDPDSFENKIRKKLYVVCIMTVVLACLMLVTLNLSAIVGHLTIAVVIFATAVHLNRFIALFLLILGLLGIIGRVFDLVFAVGITIIALFSLLSLIKLLITIYSLVVYTLISYCAFLVFYEYTFKQHSAIPAEGPTNNTPNYGAIDVENKKNDETPA